jgi:hypothetical protein
MLQIIADLFIPAQHPKIGTDGKHPSSVMRRLHNHKEREQKRNLKKFMHAHIIIM